MIQASGTHMRGVLVFMAEATLLNSAMSKYKRDHEVTVVFNGSNRMLSNYSLTEKLTHIYIYTIHEVTFCIFHYTK